MKIGAVLWRKAKEKFRRIVNKILPPFRSSHFPPCFNILFWLYTFFNVRMIFFACFFQTLFFLFIIHWLLFCLVYLWRPVCVFVCVCVRLLWLHKTLAPHRHNTGKFPTLTVQFGVEEDEEKQERLTLILCYCSAMCATFFLYSISCPLHVTQLLRVCVQLSALYLQAP